MHGAGDCLCGVVSTTTEIGSVDPGRVRAWIYGEPGEAEDHLGPHADQRHVARTHQWWKVMCLTGVDYFSTLGYQPGIAALAAGALSPLATIVLVMVTLLGALPVYRRVAEESPHGQGSIAMLERLMPMWRGKLFVLALLGFAATDFVITMTLSAADAAAHLVENPHVPPAVRGQELAVTLVLLGLLGAVFLKGFKEAIGVAVLLVVAYLGLNAVVIAVAAGQVADDPDVVGDWTTRLATEHGSPVMLVLLTLVVFPKLALGMSGFETGVAVMSHVRGAEGDDPSRPVGRTRNTKRLLTVAALVMSGYLVGSAFVTTWLVPAEEFEPGGAANGRALAYLAHRYLGDGFGTVYDVVTIAILWFAGASAMAGLLNLVPRYLPRYGMAPQWARATRPLVLVLTTVAFVVTWVFDADVDAQGGAYATGVLVLFASAGAAVTLAARRARQWRLLAAFALVTTVFVYTLTLNVVERPDGVKIAACFIAGIMTVSVASRASRAFELRITRVDLDPRAEQFVRDTARRTTRFVANEPDSRDRAEYRQKLDQIVDDNDLPDANDIIFVEVTLTDPSEFATVLDVHGQVLHGTYRVVTISSPSIPNALAALLLHVRDVTGKRPHIYFEWTEGNPAGHLARFLLFGAGEVGPMTREILRRAVPDPKRRPHVHAG